MVKIYTKTGDSGTTSLFGGKKLSKNDARVEAYGCVDELNSVLGMIIADLNYSSSASRETSFMRNSPQGRIVNKLLRIQKELFVLGTDLASPSDVKVKIPRVKKPLVIRLEQEIDSWVKNLPKLRNFILPGGSKVGSQLHLARSIARRAERVIASLSSKEKINQNALIYVNRLSDWLFVLARYVNKLENQKESIWKGRK